MGGIDYAGTVGYTMYIQSAMVTRVRKWGNSLGVRLPRSIADKAQIQDGSAVDIDIKRGAIVLRPVRKKRLRLKDFVDRITPENIHPVVDWGPPVGKEFW